MKHEKELSDEQLVEAVRSGDLQLYAGLVRRYQDKLIRYAVYLVGDSHKAADIVQNSFIKAYANLNGFNVKKKFSSWIYRIVHNEAINLIRKSKKEISLIAAKDYESRENPEEDLTRKEIIQKARDCLGQMPVLYSEPLALLFLEDKSYEDISDILRLPMGTVATRINRAKSLMKKICEAKK